METFEKMKDIKKITSELQKCLTIEWKKFKNGPLFGEYKELREMLSDFYDSKLREVIPFPSYHLAAQQIGKEFVKKSRGFGLSYDEIFPGNFEESSELDNKALGIRTFKLTIYYDNKLIGYFYLSFSHLHDKFDFPQAPILKFKSLK